MLKMVFRDLSFLTFSPSFSAFLQLLAFRAELYVPDATVLETEKGEGKRCLWTTVLSCSQEIELR